MLLSWGPAPWLSMEVAGAGQCSQSHRRLEAGPLSAAGQNDRIVQVEALFSYQTLAILPVDRPCWT